MFTLEKKIVFYIVMTCIVYMCIAISACYAVTLCSSDKVYKPINSNSSMGKMNWEDRIIPIHTNFNTAYIEIFSRYKFSESSDKSYGMSRFYNCNFFNTDKTVCVETEGIETVEITSDGYETVIGNDASRSSFKGCYNSTLLSSE